MKNVAVVDTISLGTYSESEMSEVLLESQFQKEESDYDDDFEFDL